MTDYAVGTRWVDKDDRVWAVDPDGMFTLEGQEPVLKHTAEHVASEFSPLSLLPASVDDIARLRAQDADTGDMTPPPVPKHVTVMYEHVREAETLLAASKVLDGPTRDDQILAATQAAAHAALAQLASVGVIDLVDDEQ